MGFGFQKVNKSRVTGLGASESRGPAMRLDPRARRVGTGGAGSSTEVCLRTKKTGHRANRSSKSNSSSSTTTPNNDDNSNSNNSSNNSSNSNNCSSSSSSSSSSSATHPLGAASDHRRGERLRPARAPPATATNNHDD